jgi:hypothetical protein
MKQTVRCRFTHPALHTQHSIAFLLSKCRLVLSLSHLNHVQSPIINRGRQDLASQLPEAALVRSVRSGKKVPLLWGWLCSQRQSVKYDLMLDRSIGLGITDELRRHAARICDIQGEEMVLEFQLSSVIATALAVMA